MALSDITALHYECSGHGSNVHLDNALQVVWALGPRAISTSKRYGILRPLLWNTLEHIDRDNVDDALITVYQSLEHVFGDVKEPCKGRYLMTAIEHINPFC